MPVNGVLLVAVEDIGTAGVVAAGAAHIAVDRDVTRIVLLHILDSHAVATGVAGLAGVPLDSAETADEGRTVLALAEAALRAELEALQQQVPDIVQQFGEGRPGQAICQAASSTGAIRIIVGARRPHAFGRLTHPDVVAYLRHHTSVPVDVVALQAEPPQAVGEPR